MRRNIGTRREAAARVAAALRLSVDIHVLDLGCGDGVFLEAVADVLQARFPSRFADPNALAAVLTGVEVDPGAAARAQDVLTGRFGKPSGGWDVRVADALWLDEQEEYDAVVGNPPWVRLHHLDQATRSQARSTFRTAAGSFDLCYLFVEKGLRLLAAGGQLAMIVPRGIGRQPAAAPLRDLLTAAGAWTMQALSRDCFFPVAGVDAAVLSLTKDGGTLTGPEPRPTGWPVLGDIAAISTGVPTGADAIFLVEPETAGRLGLEDDRLRPAIRGRDIRPGVQRRDGEGVRLIWPYRQDADRWVLDDLSASPRVRAYLAGHRSELTGRPRLAERISRDPPTWYRFIDPRRPKSCHRGPRLAVPDIFRDGAFAVIEDDRTVILNTCFEVLPRPGCEQAVMSTLRSSAFWRGLRGMSRALSSGYHRTSVAELRSVPLTAAVL